MERSPRKKLSLRLKLLVYFGILTTVQVLVLLTYSALHVTQLLRDNIENLTQVNLEQTAKNLNLSFESYRDVMYQLYTGDDFVAWLDNINADRSVSITTNQMRRQLRTILNSKEYIRSITIISENGKVITYDTLTPATYENSWLANFSMSQEELYDEVAADNMMHIYQTEYATSFINKDHQLFHFAHRIIDWKKLDKQVGIVIVSLDEELLSEIIQPEKMDADDYALLLGSDGSIISAADKSLLGKEFNSEEISKTHNVYSFVDEETDWTIIHVTDNSENDRRIKENIFVSIMISVASLLITLLFIWNLSGQLTHSIREVVHGMRKTKEGSLPDEVTIEKDMPPEIVSIVTQYNKTIERLEVAIQKEKEETENRQQAEIRMLEARINPHFIYNTLDTVNWMAIDKEEYDMSNAISSLANILRYAISNSSQIVTINDEVEWLKRYIYLQQYRLKNEFQCNINAADDIMDIPVHKLLIQPFVENAIIHGFENAQGVSILDVEMKKESECLSIIIRDNGKGMEQTLVDEINSLSWQKDRGTLGIGMYNALMRLHVYCNGQETVAVKSAPGEGTEIRVTFPVEIPEEKDKSV